MVNFIWENVFKRKRDENSITSFLRSNLLFHSLNPAELLYVEKIVHVRKYHPKEFVFRQGELGVGMYIIAKGAVDILVSDVNPQTLENTDVLVTRLGVGDFFGELSLVEDNGKRTASAIASSETVLIGFFKPDLIEIIERSPTIGNKIVFRLAEVLGRRLKETTEKITQIKRELKILETQHVQDASTTRSDTKTHTT